MNVDHSKYIHTRHTIRNPNFFLIDKISNDYIKDHNKKYFLYLTKCDFELFSINAFTKPDEDNFETNSYIILQ